VNRRSARDERGAVAILVALSLVVLGMACALAVDLGNIAQLHRHAEYTVDDAAISGADLLQQGTDSLTQIVTATEGYVNEDWRNIPSAAWNTCPDIPTGFSAPSGSGENCVTFNGTSTATASAINVEIPPQSIPFSVARIGGFTSGTVEASASAVVAPGVAPCALCLLGPGGLTLGLNGSGGFYVTDSAGSGNAGIAVNSSATPAAQIIGNSGSITAPQIGVVGTYSGNGFVPPPVPIQPVQDPLGYLSEPTPSPAAIPSLTYSSNGGSGGVLPAATYGNISLTGGATLTIPPGNYNSISVGGNAVLTLETGNYFITGPFTVGGTGGTVDQSGAGVLLYFTCSNSAGDTVVPCANGGQSGGSLALSGTGTVNLYPQTTGPYANLTVFYDRQNDAPMSISGTPGMLLQGTIYAKDSALSLNGTGDTLDSMIIVNSASISGNGSISVNYDASDNATLQGTPYLCSTSANNC
jgi:hypothetical protein